MGIASAWREPKIRRTTWGAMRSMNPMTPTKGTAVPVKSVASPMSNIFSRFKSTPADNACSSPNVMRSISRAWRDRIKIPTATTGKSTRQLENFWPENEPICQKTSSFKCSAESAVTTVSIALTKSEMTMPVKMIVWFSREPSSRRVIPIATSTVPSPPRKPMRGSVYAPTRGMESPVSITAAARRDAPEETPSV